MFELLYSSALRVSEMVAWMWRIWTLLIAWFMCDKARVGKDEWRRLVGRRARRLKNGWRRAPLPDVPMMRYLSVKNNRRLGVRSVQLRLGRLAKKSGLAGRVSPHVLRHSCASHFLQSSGNLRATQELLGHKSIAATQIYTRLDFQNLAKTYDKAHPKARRSTVSAK